MSIEIKEHLNFLFNSWIFWCRYSHGFLLIFWCSIKLFDWNYRYFDSLHRNISSASFSESILLIDFSKLSAKSKPCIYTLDILRNTEKDHQHLFIWCCDSRLTWSLRKQSFLAFCTWFRIKPLQYLGTLH